MNAVRDWLEAIGLGQYADAFEANDIDMDLLAQIDDHLLQDIGISSAGHRLRIRNAIAKFAPTSIAEAKATSAVGAPEVPAPSAERRQLTVMFCDLVGSTAMSARLDPEELREVIAAYHQCVAEAVRRFDGLVAKYMGDGVLVYFGYPRAHEDDAERAVRAGLDIVAAVGRLDVPAVGKLQVRIGIATGLVVVGDLVGEGAAQEQAVVGETPNLAARLQALAEPRSVIIAPATRRLLGNRFALRPLGRHEIKGLSEPVEVWTVEGVSASESRFESVRGSGLTGFVGREYELGLLVERWNLAQDGEGQVVLLSAEPGIGKSRILSELRGRLEAQPATSLRLHCSPYYVNSAFYPIIDNFQRVLQFARDDTAEQKLDKLEALVVGQYGRPREDLRFIAAMLSIPCEECYGALAMTPQKFKDETLRALVDTTEAIARRQPTVMLFEDAHWADPTTLEVMDLLIHRARNMPLLVVVTHRPEFSSRWSHHGHVAALGLTKLTRAQSTALVSRLSGGKALPKDLLDQILQKTDGVPLFVEELTKSILESADLMDAGDRWEYAGQAGALAIPTTLRDSLMARLDRFTPVKEIAQIGAAIGREFSWELIAAVAPHARPELDKALAQLTASGLAFQQGTSPDAVYTFKHALVAGCRLRFAAQAPPAGIARSDRQGDRGALAHCGDRARTLGVPLHRGEGAREGGPALAAGGQLGAEPPGAHRGDRTFDQRAGAGPWAAAFGGARRQRARSADVVGDRVDGAQRLAGSGGLGQPAPRFGAGEFAAPQQCIGADTLRAVRSRVLQGRGGRVAALGHAADGRCRDL
jgi:class 3 adenylate cyclase